jgi:Zn-dependent oligopeptidase
MDKERYLSLKESTVNLQVWHKDVQFYRVNDIAGEPIAYFYFDPYSRPSEKRGGAWMDEVLGRSRLLALKGSLVRLPVAHMVCNQTPPVGDDPSLMTFREVRVLTVIFPFAVPWLGWCILCISCCVFCFAINEF